MTIRLMHVSDIHAGPPFAPEIAAVVVREAQAYAPDAFVVSGDFVQRADELAQWQTITAWLAQTPQPRFVVPGNHDVPLYNIWNRLFNPYIHYTTHISSDLMPVMHLNGVSLIGVNTAFGWTIDGGYMSPAQQAHLRTAAANTPLGNRRVLVMHHHLLNPPGVGRRNRVANPKAIARLLDECQIDVVLCGHIHLSYVGHTRDLVPLLGRGTIICQAGTATSQRGKGRERHMCAYNTVEISATQLIIRRHVYDAHTQKFVIHVEHHEELRA